jgi:hypothetical protein
MHFNLPSLFSVMVIAAGTAQACLEYQATIGYDKGYMQGTAKDNGKFSAPGERKRNTLLNISSLTGVQTCSIYSIGSGQQPNQWWWKCISGFSMHVYNGGKTAAYCNPSNCYTFDISCNYATDIIGCGAAVFGC